MNKISNRQVVCEELLQAAREDKDLIVVCSDSRGSASLTPFAQTFPQQFVEMGIAEQNLVTVSAGLASCGKKVFAASPASFLSTRSYEQIKVDVAYSRENVKLLGISGGVSYGALGMTHHSCQDIAAMCALPDMRVYFPSDRFLTARLIRALLQDEKPAYIRLSRSATKDVYDETLSFTLDQANILHLGEDVTIIACGETVPEAAEAAALLRKEGIDAGVIDMYCLKPLDTEAIRKATATSRLLVTAEEHSPFGGLGSLVSQVVASVHPMQVLQLSLPDGHMVSGSGPEIFKSCGLDAAGMAARIREALSGGKS